MPPDNRNSRSPSVSERKKPYAKSNRTAKACKRCHSRKTRCSGTIPCTFCVSRNLPCEMDDSAYPAKSEVSNGTNGISPTAFVNIKLPLHAPMDGSSLEAQQRMATNALLPNHRPPHDSIPSIPQTYHGQAAMVDTPIFPTVDLDLVPRQHSISASPSSLHKDKQEAISPTHQEDSVSGVTLPRFQRMPTTPIVEADITKLVDRRSALRYIDLYFSEAEWIYRLHPSPAQIHMYHEAIWLENDQAHTYKYGTVGLPVGTKSILAALLAFGALFDGKQEDSELLYRAARQAYLDIIELVNLESVALAMQMAVFQINTNRSNELWSTLAVAVRLSHALNLHRPVSSQNKPPAERQRRVQLWHASFNHEVWHSLSTGRPCLSSDWELESSHSIEEVRRLGSIGELGSAIYLMRVRLSALWTQIHTTLYSRRNTSANISWLHHIPDFDRQLGEWEQALKNLVPTEDLTTPRPDRKQYQVVLLAYAIIRIILHRSFLIQRDIHHLPGSAHAHQRSVSETAVLDGALQVLQCTRQLIQLGIHLGFWFLVSNIQIAYLALCEYMQNLPQGDRRYQTTQRGLQTARGLLEEIAQSGHNSPAALQILEKLGSIRDVLAYRGRQMDGYESDTALQLHTNKSAPEQPENSLPGAEINHLDGLPDLDWFINAHDNVSDIFAGSPAPAAENLAWWLLPYPDAN